MKTFYPRSIGGLVLALVANTCALANVAQAPHRLAVMSLVGDSIQVVTYEGQTGRATGANDYLNLPFGQAQLDLVAIKAVGEAAQSVQPNVSVELLSANEPALFAGQHAWFDGNDVHLPEAITAAVTREHADELLLVTKYRGLAHIRLEQSSTGSGNLEGMGFYLDRQLPLRASDGHGGRAAYGFIAPYVYIQATLIDVASGIILGQSRIAEGYSIATARSSTGNDPWSVLTPTQKVETLRGLLDRQLRKAVQILFAQRAHASDSEHEVGR